MAGAGKKTFTAGEVLTASDVNTYLMEQSVMNFAGTAARASAIPTPSTGMTSYIGVTGTASIPQIETYTGSAWQTPYAMTLLSNSSFTAASTVDVTSVFTSSYQNYKVILRCNSPSGTQVNIYAQLLSASTPATTNYLAASRTWNTASNTASFNTADSLSTAVSIGHPASDNGQSITIFDVGTPQLAIKTTFTGSNVGAVFGAYSSASIFGGYHNDNTSYNGIRFITSASTISGTIQIYGYRNA